MEEREEKRKKEREAFSKEINNYCDEENVFNIHLFQFIFKVELMKTFKIILKKKF